MQNMYDKISPFFTLLLVYDLEDIPLQQLNLLYKNLQNQKPIEPSLQPLYNQLEEASKSNIAEKLKKKKDKRSMQQKVPLIKQQPKPPKPILKQQSFIDQSKINESTMQDILPNEYKQIERRFGRIYNGELTITLPLSDLIKTKKIYIQFYIDSKKRESSIKKQTLAQLGLNSANPSLLVDERKQKFQISTNNRLGLSFLQKNNVILECNYRPEQSSFELVYTQ